MVDLIEFPTNKVAPDSLPDAGDKYEAFGLSQKLKPPMLTFVFPDWPPPPMVHQSCIPSRSKKPRPKIGWPSSPEPVPAIAWSSRCATEVSYA